MKKKTLDLEALLRPDDLACQISQRWMEWNSYRQKKLEEWKELRNYLFATDTRTTSNSRLPWVNSTTAPKLTQIRDNLHANYFSAIFPERGWMRWEAGDADAASVTKRKVIQAYMENKTRQSDFTATVSQLLDDYILYGNAFCIVDYESNYNTVNGEVIPGYVGPKVYRISPYDICFNPTAVSFVNTPKIVKSLKNIGEIKKNHPEVYKKIKDNREMIRRQGSDYEEEKSNAFIADGFSSVVNYYESNYVEILTFYGDIFDTETEELMENRIIKIVDRAYVVSNEENPSWLGTPPIFHVGWRERPDNLYAMGPLDNLVGMQYRLDHLENLKADVFDQIALPMVKIRGEVEDFEYQPGERIYVGDDGDVNYLVPDTTALNADFQISNLMDNMEELAGAPRQAMGIRTPGEKTAFEVNTLQTAANRVFQHKAAHFERVFLEKILNSMLEQARRNIDEADKIRVMDETTGAQMFLDITKEDITARGKIIPVGARHFAERSKRIQELNNLLALRADPSVGAHISGKELARIITGELGEDKLFGENITLIEQAETEQLMLELQTQLQKQAGVSQQIQAEQEVGNV